MIDKKMTIKIMFLADNNKMNPANIKIAIQSGVFLTCLEIKKKKPIATNTET